MLTLVTLSIITRVTILEVQRGANWDNNLRANGCLISNDNQAKLLGAEIKYPLFGLGIEDVNRWEWMSNNYRNWLSSPKLKKQITCE